MKNFFEKIDFSFGTKDAEIKPSKMIVSNNTSLTQKLEGNVFIYDSPQYTQSSFYVISTPLSEKELFELRRFIWNENKYDLYFLIEKSGMNLGVTLFYAKTAPHEQTIKIASFSGGKEDQEELDKIKKHNFQSGAFWLHYSDLTKEIKRNKSIDEKLVEQLKQLKDRLNTELSKQIEEPSEIVQALIDRTLFIKFLEDNHIINSFFYNHHFSDIKLTNNEIGYKSLLENNDINAVNKLFDLINQLFNNVLFKSPHIDGKYLTEAIMHLINEAISQYDWNTGQLSLFDFQFDVIPIEFISHIYEVFLEETQLDEGIYYTPDKLAHLIIDDVITDKGTILDPSCGSGMFLVLAFRKLQELNPIKSKSVSEIIQYRNKLVRDYIFGIEKSNTAWRLTVFSLYLEILKDIPAEDVKKFIQEKIRSNSELRIFIDFSDNIINCNALEVAPNEIPHKGRSFNYIVGNPPFFQIKSKNEEMKFINEYSLTINKQTQYAKDIVGYNQISQAFMLKLKDWANEETSFGFIQNSSNFYNKNSENFQSFFFGQYNVKSIYELSRVNDILFRKAKENILVTIFSNKVACDNVIKYYPVYKVLFSSLFDLVIIQEDQRIDIPQKKILEKEIVLRDYLIGNEYDLALLNTISQNEKLDSYLLNYKSFRGLERATNKTVYEFFKLSKEEIELLSKDGDTSLQQRFARERYLSEVKSDYYNTPYIYDKSNIGSFRVIKFDGYINRKDVNKNNFRRHQSHELYEGGKILFNRFGEKIEAAYIEFDCFFSTYLYVVKLKNKDYFHLFTAILNSELVNYYLALKFKKRVGNNYSNLDVFAIRNIPIPCFSDNELILEITKISQSLTNGEIDYNDKTKIILNELIYDLYDLSYLERQRIKDFSSTQQKDDKLHFDTYKQTIATTLEIYFSNRLLIDIYENGQYGIDIVIVAIFINGAYETMPSSEKTFKYILDKIVCEQNGNVTFLREKIIGKDCIYLIKDKQFCNWTETKAFEDAKNILKLIQS